MRPRTVLHLALSILAIPGLASAANIPISVGPGNNFSPAIVNINVGDTVTWTRQGGFHSVTADDGSFTSPVNSTWGTFQRTFNSAGEVQYFCEVHSTANGTSMNGVVNVTGGGGGNAGTIQFSTASTSAAENGGNKTITVTRSGGDDGPVSVEFETVDGSATFPTDYTQANETLNWADNDDNNKTFVVPIVNDSTEEPSQSFTIRLQNPGGGATLGTPNVITVTINDDDAPSGSPGTIRFTSGTANTSEGAANVTLTAERTGGSTGLVSAVVNTANGTASAGTDYQAISNGTVSWNNGETANKTIVIPIVGDSAEEPNETFTATLSAPTGGASIGNIPTSTVTIQDDDVTITPCVADANTLCLAAGSGDPSRFRVRVTWENFTGTTGPGFAVPFSSDSGFFYFFSPTNLELLVKMVRGCGTSLDAYWFFYAAASNVGLEYEVVDTLRGVTKTYSNPVGTFASFGDINALATCP